MLRSLINIRCGKRISGRLVLYALSLNEDVEHSPGSQCGIGLLLLRGLGELLLVMISHKAKGSES